YHHAQSNPRAVMHGRPLTAEAYDASRWIVEPFRLYDCCLENDGAAAVIVVSAERARDLKARPAFLLGVAQGSEHRNAARGHNAPLYATSSFTTVAPHLYAMAGVKPSEVDVVQSYENFTGGVLMSLVEHGFFTAEEADEFLVVDNLVAPAGRLPLNTSGGNLAERYMHGLELARRPVPRRRVAARGRQGNRLQLGARVASRASGAQGARALYSGARRAAPRGPDPHGRQPARRSAAARHHRRAGRGGLRAARRRRAPVHPRAMEGHMSLNVDAPNQWR